MFGIINNKDVKAFINSVAEEVCMKAKADKELIESITKKVGEMIWKKRKK